MVNMNSLFNGANIFQDTAATAGLAAEPTFGATTRQADAMEELAASVPLADKGVRRMTLRSWKLPSNVGSGHVAKPSDDNGWKVAGMKTSLEAYQVPGVASMRKREMSATEPKGGILAGEMGLGKTIQALANFINALPEWKPGRLQKCRTTLIIASPTLVS